MTIHEGPGLGKGPRQGLTEGECSYTVHIVGHACPVKGEK